MNDPLLYEINTRCWLAELSAQTGRRLTLADVPEAEFDFWRRSGFTHIWLMGVWTLGRRGRHWSRKVLAGCPPAVPDAEIAGSPYAITGYDVAREFGGDAALQKFRRRLNAQGLRLVLDFIPNHTALDHPWVRTRPEFYITSQEGGPGMTQPFRGSTQWFAHGSCGHDPPWMDTLQLDYRQETVRRAMIEELLGVAGRCDGVRCDMAMLALNGIFARIWRAWPGNSEKPSGDSATEFWRDAIDAVHARHAPFLFLAEAYWDCEARLQELGFNYTYDKVLYDRLVSREAPRTTEYLQSRPAEFVRRSAHFLENHDEPRIASLLSFEEHRAAALLVLALPGLRLLHEGQLGGLEIHANLHLACRAAESADERLGCFYERLLAALQQTAVGRGQGRLLPAQPAWPDNPTHRNFVLLQWQDESCASAFDLAVIHLGATRGQCWAPLSAHGLAEADWRLTDLLGDEIHERRGAELSQRGLYLDLLPHGAQLFHCQRMP